MIWSGFCKVIIVVACVVLALPSYLGCAKEAQPTDKYVTYLSLSDLTGPGAGLAFPLVEAIDFALNDINSRGGVDGVKVKMLIVDTRYDMARTVSAYKRYRTEHKVIFALIPHTPAVKALAPQMEADKIPSMTPADGEFQAKQGWVFLAATPYQDGFAASMDWIMNDWKAKGNQKMPAVGYMTWDSQYGRDTLRGGQEYADKVGVKLLPPEYFPPGAADHTVWLSRINDAGADYCFIGGVDPTQSLILRDAFKLGLTKKIQFVSDYLGLDENVGVKLHPEATEGAVLVSPIVRGDEARQLPQVNELWNKYAKGPISEMRALFPLGILLVKYTTTALKMALDEVGYDQLGGGDIYQGMQKLTGTDADGVAGPCAYSPTNRKGGATVRFYRIQNAKNIPITGWITAPDAVSLHKGW